MISYKDFQGLDLRIGKVISSARVEGTDRLIRLQIDLGSEQRQILAGMAGFFDPEYLLGKLVPVLVNLEPRKFKGLESQGMILAADVEGTPVLLHPERDVPAGTIVR